MKRVQDCKFAELLGSTLTDDPKEVIYNFSSFVLSEKEKAFVCEGSTFTISTKKLKFENCHWQFEIFPRDVCDSSNKVSDNDCLLVKLNMLVYHLSGGREKRSSLRKFNKRWINSFSIP